MRRRSDQRPTTNDHPPVRVIAGSARGRTLASPPKPRASGRPGVRPTSDLIRGVIFDILDAMGADYSRVLDLYAGTGALGIEALSRGDGEADFVESDGPTASIIAENLQRTGFEARGRIHRLTVDRAITRLSAPYTLVLADPPYYDEGGLASVAAVAASPLVDDATVLVLEHFKKTAAPEDMGRLRLRKARAHGDTAVAIYAGKEVS